MASRITSSKCKIILGQIDQWISKSWAKAGQNLQNVSWPWFIISTNNVRMHLVCVVTSHQWPSDFKPIHLSCTHQNIWLMIWQLLWGLRKASKPMSYIKSIWLHILNNLYQIDIYMCTYQIIHLRVSSWIIQYLMKPYLTISYHIIWYHMCNIM